MHKNSQSGLEYAKIIAAEFGPLDPEISISPLGNGLINDTYLVTSLGQHWVLQRINSAVFKEPKLLLENLSLLSEHVDTIPQPLRKLKIPGIIKTSKNGAYFEDSTGGFWRGLQFIPNSYSKEACENLEDAAQIGHALGVFHSLCSRMDVAGLHDTLPGFHIAPMYFEAYRQVLSDPVTIEHDSDFDFCANFINTRQTHISSLENAKQNGELPLRVIHGDPKVNNFLFDKESASIVSIIDLDTVKPGLIHYDIGDCLRSACLNEASGRFNLDIGAVILKNYLAEAAGFFNESDYRYLYPAIHLIPLELGIRFFTDYLSGDQYFKVKEPKQNLYRAIEQFRLCFSIEEQRSAIEDVIEQLK